MSDHTLRSGLIRLAYENPDLRGELLPLLTKRAEDASVAEAKQAVEVLARLVAGILGGTAAGVEARAYGEGYVGAKAEITVSNLPSITSGGDDDAAVGVTLGVNPEGTAYVYFSYLSGPPRLRQVADKVNNLSVKGADLGEAVQKATKSVQALPALLEDTRNLEAMRRKANGHFKQAVPDLNEWVRKALIQSGVVGPVKVWGHPVGGSGTFTTDEGAPYHAERIIIEGLLTEDEGRDRKRSQEVYANTRKVLAKALSRFFYGGVTAKLSSKPAYWSAYTYNTTAIFYFKDAPVPNMKLAAGQPNYADLTKRLLLLLGAMSPPQSKMVEAVSQTLQAWATTNGLDVRHNLKEIAEDLLYNAYRPGKPIVDARQVLRVMQEQYPTAFTSRVAAAGIPVTLKKKLSLKDGTVIEAGEKGTLRFNEQTPRQAVVDFDVRPNTKLGCRLLGDYFGRPFMKEPSMSALENMGDGIAKSVTGKKVEPDGYGPDGSPSWLLALGYI